MKGSRGYMDIGSILDEVFEAAKDFGERMKQFDPASMQGAEESGERQPGSEGQAAGDKADYDENGPFAGKGPFGERGHFGMHRHGNCGPFGAGASAWFDAGDENTDFYPNFSYPPMNCMLTKERMLVFEFALAGFEEKNISLSFQGDYMVFSAHFEGGQPEEGARYFKRRLKMKDVDRQKYYVPADKFDQEKVKAVFRNGILKVTVPPRDIGDVQDGIRIEIVREGE